MPRFIVICDDDHIEGQPVKRVNATSKIFPNEKQAWEYAGSVAASRNPEAIPVRESPCAICGRHKALEPGRKTCKGCTTDSDRDERPAPSLTFKLEIKLGNAAMLTDTDIRDALHATAYKMRISEHPEDGDDGIVHDYNGNPVGEWKVSADAPAVCILCESGTREYCAACYRGELSR